MTANTAKTTTATFGATPLRIRQLAVGLLAVASLFFATAGYAAAPPLIITTEANYQQTQVLTPMSLQQGSDLNLWCIMTSRTGYPDLTGTTALWEGRSSATSTQALQVASSLTYTTDYPHRYEFALDSTETGTAYTNWVWSLIIVDGVKINVMGEGDFDIKASAWTGAGSILSTETAKSYTDAAVSNHAAVVATTNSLGHVIVGDGLNIDTNGVLNADLAGLTLQDVTDNGATTTNSIVAESFSGIGSDLTAVPMQSESMGEYIYYDEVPVLSNSTITAQDWINNNNGYFVGVGTVTNVTLTLPVVADLLAAGIATLGKEAKFALVGGNFPFTIVDQDGQGFDETIAEIGKQITVRLTSQGAYQITQDSRTDVGAAALRLYQIIEEDLVHTNEVPIWRATVTSSEDPRYSAIEQIITTSITATDFNSPTIMSSFVLPDGTLIGELPETPYAFTVTIDRDSGVRDSTVRVQTYLIEGVSETLISTTSSGHPHGSTPRTTYILQGIIPSGTEMSAITTLRFDLQGILDSGGGSATLNHYYENESGSYIAIGAPASSIAHNALASRDAQEAHPATAISHIPSGNIEAIEAGAAIDELDADHTAHTNLSLSSGAHGGELDPIWSAVSNTVTTGAALGATAVQSEADPLAVLADGSRAMTGDFTMVSGGDSVEILIRSKEGFDGVMDFEGPNGYYFEGSSSGGHEVSFDDLRLRKIAAAVDPTDAPNKLQMDAGDLWVDDGDGSISYTGDVSFAEDATNTLTTTYYSASNRWALVQIIGTTTNVTFVSP